MLPASQPSAFSAADMIVGSLHSPSLQRGSNISTKSLTLSTHLKRPLKICDVGNVNLHFYCKKRNQHQHRHYLQLARNGSEAESKKKQGLANNFLLQNAHFSIVLKA